MSKFYLLGNTKAIRSSLVLMAIAAGSYQSLHAQTCTNAANVNQCTGGNITQNFNSNNGAFTSTNFTYNAVGGNWQKTPTVKGNSYVITSGVYHVTSTGGSLGFSTAGTTGGLNTLQVRVLTAGGTQISSCTPSFISANQVCVTFSVPSNPIDVKFEFTFNAANGSSGDNQTFVFDNFAIGAAGLPLPVKLDNFAADKDASGIKLSWRAAEESGVARYEVQRSSDGVNFQTIGIVSAESKKAYSYLDVLPSSANNFYRLKIVDLDNTARISHVVSVKSKLSVGIEAYPNPVRDRLIVQHPKAVMGTRLQIINLTGQVLKDVQVPANAVVTPMDFTGLSNGTYYLVFRSGSESFSQRVTKQ